MPRLRHFLLAVMLLAFCAPIARPVRAAELLGIDFNGVLYDVAVPAGLATNPRPTGIATASGIGFSPTGQLYVHDAATNHLFRVNHLTGESTQIGFLGIDVTEGDLAFHPQTGILYGAQTAGADRLYTIDTTTGQATIIGTIIDSGDISALAFDADGSLWALDTSFNQSLYRLDPSTGSILSTIAIDGDYLGNTAGMAFEPDTGLLWVASNNLVNNANRFYQLSTESGLLRPMGMTGLPGGLSGLQFIPEPTTLSMLLMAGVALSLRRRALRRP